MKIFKLTISFILLCFVENAGAIPVTITATAPDDPLSVLLGDITDFHIAAIGDGENEFSTRSTQITSDYNISTGLTSHDIFSASIGFQDAAPLSTFDNEGICFFFPLGNPLEPGETFTIAFDVTFLDGTEIDIDSLSGLGEVVFSHELGFSPSQSPIVEVGDVVGFPGAGGVLPPPSGLNPFDLQLVFRNDAQDVFQVVTEPTTFASIFAGLSLLILTVRKFRKEPNSPTKRSNKIT